MRSADDASRPSRAKYNQAIMQKRTERERERERKKKKKKQAAPTEQADQPHRKGGGPQNVLCELVCALHHSLFSCDIAEPARSQHAERATECATLDASNLSLCAPGARSQSQKGKIRKKLACPPKDGAHLTRQNRCPKSKPSDVAPDHSLSLSEVEDLCLVFGLRVEETQ